MTVVVFSSLLFQIAATEASAATTQESEISQSEVSSLLKYAEEFKNYESHPSIDLLSPKLPIEEIIDANPTVDIALISEDPLELLNQNDPENLVAIAQNLKMRTQDCFLSDNTRNKAWELLEMAGCIAAADANSEDAYQLDLHKTLWAELQVRQ